MMQKGYTLVELMMVFIIGGAFLLAGFALYKNYADEQERNRLLFYVDSLFQGLDNYYQANCRELSIPTYSTPTKRGLLDPTHNPAPATNYPVTPILTQLATPGYLQGWPFAGITFIDNNDANVYVVQFNGSTANRMEPNYSGAGVATIGMIYMWQEQVAVKLLDATQSAAYKSALQADCVSKKVGNIVTPCATVVPDPTNNYLVWQRIPSSSLRRQSASTYMYSLPYLKVFNQMYSTYGIVELKNNAAVPYLPPPNNRQYYLCNG